MNTRPGVEVGPGLRAGQLGTRDVWALGVGIVVCGQFFGWNLGLEGNGPVAMLIASLVVCLLFQGWTLTLAELAVAMPTAGGPMDYGLRAGGRWLGFLMGWSMLLECLFGGVATALGVGGYVAFLLDPAAPDPAVAVRAGLACVAVVFLLQAWGVREQGLALIVMTWAALLALAVFWVAAAAHFSWPRFWTDPVLPPDKGWFAVLDALPFALWWLIIIEGAALAAEEVDQPRRSLPRGLTWAVLTVVALVCLTMLTACGAVDSDRLARRDGAEIAYPLAEALRLIPAGSSPLVLYGFGALALFGLVASYHGLLYSSSRQTFAMGRAGWLPPALGATHDRRRTPVPALAACSALTAAFVVANLWYEPAIKLAVLTAGFAALVLYILSMVALGVLRRREPWLFDDFRAPLYRVLPGLVVGLSLLTLFVYPRLGAAVVALALTLYPVGVGYFWWRSRRAGDPVAPAQPPTRQARPAPPRRRVLEGSALAVLAAVLLLVAARAVAGLPDGWVAAGLLGLLGSGIALVGWVALLGPAAPDRAISR